MMTRLLFIFLLVMPLVYASATQPQAKLMNTSSLNDKIEKNDVFYLVDIRTMAEYQAGHINTAMWIPRGMLEFKVEKLIPKKDAPIIVYCKAGTRSAKAVQTLIDMGYTHVYDLEGGLKSWNSDNLPLYNILGKIEVIEPGAKANLPHGNGLIKSMNP